MREKLKAHHYLVMFFVLLLLALAGYLAYKFFFPELDLQQLLSDFSNLLGAWTYVIAGVFSFAETGAFIGLIAPGETLLIISGAVAGQGVINLYLLIAIAWVAGIAGDSFSYWLGRKLGNAFLVKHGPKFGLNETKLNKIIDYFTAHGGKTILIGRFIGMIRAFAPFIAGSSRMEYRRFLPFSVLGVGLQVSLAIVLGFLFSKNIDLALNYISKFGFFFAALVIALIALYVFSKYLRLQENRHRIRVFLLSKHYLSWSVYCYDSIKPGLKFFFSRFIPGEKLGLELTTLTAIFAVSSFNVVAYVRNFADNPQLITFGDQTAVNISNYLRSNLLTDLAEVFVIFGSRPVLTGVVLLAAIIFIWRHNIALLATLLFSVLMIESGSNLVNELILRPQTSSFPNHEAALSVVYVWLAIVFVTRIRPKTLHSSLIVFSSILITVLIGFAGVYLGDNYLSDSNAGWSYGVAVFSLLSALFIVFSSLHEEMRLHHFKKLTKSD